MSVLSAPTCACGADVRSVHFRRRRRWFAFLFGLFFNLHPALRFPLPNLGLVPLEGPSHGTLATPAQLPQDAPSLRRIVTYPTFLFDQVSYAPSRPQTGFVSQRFRPAQQSAFDAPQVGCLQARLASGAPGLLQRLASARQSAGPSDSLTADARPPGGPLPPEERLAAAALRRANAALPVSRSLVEHLLDFPCSEDSTRTYRMSTTISPSGVPELKDHPIFCHSLLHVASAQTENSAHPRQC